MKEYQFVFIDADDTLFDYKAAEKHALTSSFNEYNITCTDYIISEYSKINKQLWLDYENKIISQELLRTERFRLLSKSLEININEYEFSEKYVKHLAESSVLMNDAVFICQYLHNKYQIAIITNGISSVQRNRLKTSEINPYIDFLIISEEAKCNKPNIEIFQYAENITKFTNKEKMIIIGDSLSSDIMGGINYGIDTCWLNNEGITINNKNINPDYIISSLKEVKKFL